ncbi:MAG: hypothetical protein HOV80_28180 [Polyangiaceae bacterium]|nr:hypothetical protein [Polyangiaceae bacterium]
MDPNLLYGLRLLHFLGMAVWFAGGLGIAGDVRKTIARGKPHTEILVSRVSRALNIGSIAAVVTIGSGLGMVFGLGGFGAVGPRIHAGFGLAILTLAIEIMLLKPASFRLGDALSTGDGRELRPLAGRIAMLAGITHALKLVTLVLMVFRFGGR